MEMRTVFFVGKPGSGKGTQAKLLSERTEWPIFGSSGEFRKIEGTDSQMARKIKKEMGVGILWPSWFSMYLYQNVLFSLREEDSVIFDGFNRKVPEVQLIVDSLTWLERPYAVFYLRISDEEVRRRLALRKETEGRADDSAVEKRLEEYYAHTEAAISLFREAGVLIEVEGEGAPEDIAKNIAAKLSVPSTG